MELGVAREREREARKRGRRREGGDWRERDGVGRVLSWIKECNINRFASDLISGPRVNI